MDRDDKAMMLSPDKWPRWPVLPLKRSTNRGFPETGFITEGKWIVYLTNLWEPNFSDCEKIGYADVDGLLSDGWVVD